MLKIALSLIEQTSKLITKCSKSLHKKDTNATGLWLSGSIVGFPFLHPDVIVEFASALEK